MSYTIHLYSNSIFNTTRRIYKKIETAFKHIPVYTKGTTMSAVETQTNTTYYQLNKEKIQKQYALKREDKVAYQIEYNLINHDKYLDYLHYPNPIFSLSYTSPQNQYIPYHVGLHP